MCKDESLLSFGEIRILEKHPVSLIVIGGRWKGQPAVKTLLQFFDMTVLNTVWQWRGLQTASLKVSLKVELVYDGSISRSLFSYHINISECVHGILEKWEADLIR